MEPFFKVWRHQKKGNSLSFVSFSARNQGIEGGNYLSIGKQIVNFTNFVAIRRVVSVKKVIKVSFILLSRTANILKSIYTRLRRMHRMGSALCIFFRSMGYCIWAKIKKNFFKHFCKNVKIENCLNRRSSFSEKNCYFNLC